MSRKPKSGAGRQALHVRNLLAIAVLATLSQHTSTASAAEQVIYNLNFNDNRIPDGWTFVNGSCCRGGTSGITNSRLTAVQLNGSGTLKTPISIAPDVVSLKFDWDGNLFQASGGMAQGISLYDGSGKRYDAQIGYSQFQIPGSDTGIWEPFSPLNRQGIGQLDGNNEYNFSLLLSGNSLTFSGARNGSTVFNSTRSYSGLSASALASIDLRVEIYAGAGAWSETWLDNFKLTSSSVPGLNNPSITAPATFSGNYLGDITSTATIAASSLALQTGSAFSLGANETIVLDNGNGTLTVAEGAVFSGNGTIRGNISNAGLVRIPIVTLSQVTGGQVQIQSQSVITATAPVAVNTGTFVSFYSGGGSGGGSTGGSGGGSSGGGSTTTPVSTPGSIATPRVITLQAAAPVVRGTFSVDASLKVTGSYTQEDSGILRLFVGGHDQANFADGASQSGGTYSQLLVGNAVTLDGELQVVLQPELFAGFNYSAKIGDTFDFVISDSGISLAAGLEFGVFVTDVGKGLFKNGASGLSFAAYSSGLAGDPDKLWRINETVFSFALVDAAAGGQILRGTLVNPLAMTAAVPEPGTWALVLAGGLGLAGWVRRGRRQPARH